MWQQILSKSLGTGSSSFILSSALSWLTVSLLTWTGDEVTSKASLQQWQHRQERLEVANILLPPAQRAALLFLQPSTVAGTGTWSCGIHRVWGSWTGWCWGRDMPISRRGDISASHFYLTLQAPPWSEVLCIQVLLHLHLQKRSGEPGIMERRVKVREGRFHSQWAVVQEV